MRHTTRALRSLVAVTALAAGSAFAAAPSQAAPPVSDPTVIGNLAPKRLNGERLQFDLGEYANVPTVMGAQVCDPLDETAPMPIAGRNWMYYDAQDDTSGLSTDLLITRWVDAAGALAAVPTNEGACTLLDGWTVAPWPGVDPATHLLLVSSEGLQQAAAVVRVGDVLVSSNVSDWDGTADEVAAAQKSAEQVAKTVERRTR